MSLLNDALRAAEQRQQQPTVSGAYTGQTHPAPRSRLPLMVLVILLLAAGGAALWWFLVGSGPQDRSVTDEPPMTRETAPPESAKATPKPEVMSPSEGSPAPQVAASEQAAQTPPANQAVAERPPEENPVPPQPVASDSPEAAPAHADNSTRVAEPEAPQTQAGVEPDSDPVAVPAKIDRSEATQKPESEALDGEQAVTEVKQQRETPEAIDRRTRKALKDLLASGRTLEAEQRLETITARQPAPGSREIFAREMLVQNMPERALAWLPESLTLEHPGLRLLRARAQLAQGSLEQAVATLQSRVPPVEDHVEYRVTLATLLQQAGQAEVSAGQWSELIAYDDSRAAWWLGLAIALESGGRTRSAARAYAQAATMPGLSESLTEYARARLRALQAES